mgnify:CR=1 FL=1
MQDEVPRADRQGAPRVSNLQLMTRKWDTVRVYPDGDTLSGDTPGRGISSVLRTSRRDVRRSSRRPGTRHWRNPRQTGLQRSARRRKGQESAGR